MKSTRNFFEPSNGNPLNLRTRATPAAATAEGVAPGSEELRAMLRPYDAALMQVYAVSRAVNSVKNDTEECIEPVKD